MITNKPKMDQHEAGFNIGTSSTDAGGWSYSLEGFANLPLIENKLSARVAFYNVAETGYIDNVPSARQIPLSNPGFAADTDPDRETAFNDQFVEEDFNDTTYRGIRIGGLYYINHDWELLVQHQRQDLEADGVFDSYTLMRRFQGKPWYSRGTVYNSQGSRI